MRKWVALDEETAQKLTKLMEIFNAEFEEEVVKFLVNEAYEKCMEDKRIKQASRR